MLKTTPPCRAQVGAEARGFAPGGQRGAPLLADELPALERITAAALVE
jgi:hypothetical protein